MIADRQVSNRDGSFRKSPADTLSIAGIEVSDLTGEEAIKRIRSAIDENGFLRVAFLNAHAVNVSRQDPRYRSDLADFLVLADGIGVDLGARLLHGRKFRENLNGTDFVPRLVESLAAPITVALVGGMPGVAERAAETLRRRSPTHRFVAVSDGFFADGDALTRILSELEALHADIVLVGLGIPMQEWFIAEHLDQRHGKVLIGVGALFDFLSGRVRRAPPRVRRLRLEWAFRLMLEPGRLWQRYVLGNPRFLVGILRDRASRR